MAESPRVTIEADGIHILWEDGHQGYYPHRHLRGECPCATCVHEMTGQRMVRAQDVAENVVALDWMPVGRYALQFLWSDAHDTGIYPFPLLKDLCRCNECSRSQAR